MSAKFTGMIDFTTYIGCPGCGTIMDRLDPLGQIEVEARGLGEPLTFRAVFGDTLTIEAEVRDGE